MSLMAVGFLEQSRKTVTDADTAFHLWLDHVLANLPEWCQTGWFSAVLILLASFLAGWIAHRVLIGTLLIWTRKTTTTLDEDILQRLQLPIVMSVVFYGTQFALERLQGQGSQPVQLTSEQLAWSNNLLATLALFVWTIAALRVASLLLASASKSPGKFRVVETRTFPLFENLTRVLILGGSVYSFLIIWNIDATGMLTSAGVAGVVLGFAAKDTLSNLFAGIFIVADAPYRINDYIVLDNGVRGKVINIGLRSTRVMTRDDIEITIPNAVIGASQITNQSGGGHTRMRVRIKISVAYDADIELARSILMEVAESEPMVCKKPEPRVRFRRFGESGLEWELLVWVNAPEDRGRATDALNTNILERFRAAEIEIPYPKRDVYLHQQ